MPRGSVKFESVAEARSHGVCSEMLRNTMEATKQEAGQLEFEQGEGERQFARQPLPPALPCPMGATGLI